MDVGGYFVFCCFFFIDYVDNFVGYGYYDFESYFGEFSEVFELWVRGRFYVVSVIVIWIEIECNDIDFYFINFGIYLC